MATHISTRYFIFLTKTKNEAKEMKNKIEIFINEKLKLELNEKSRYFPNSLGVDFCGYKIFETHILLRKRFKNKLKKSINLWNKLYTEEKLDIKKMSMSFNSFKAHASHSNSYHFIQKKEALINFVYK
ncbi:MAG: hypothetical protein PHQ89_05520 [Bacilli bacterium]|nr:hypothetical protein [Bacilli bacterium]